jgi:hypothetical protein
VAASSPSDTWHLPPQAVAARTVYPQPVNSVCRHGWWRQVPRVTCRCVNCTCRHRLWRQVARVVWWSFPPRRRWSFLAISLGCGLFWQFTWRGGLFCQKFQFLFQSGYRVWLYSVHYLILITLDHHIFVHFFLELSKFYGDLYAEK